jgi:hypothetical protein
MGGSAAEATEDVMSTTSTPTTSTPPTTVPMPEVVAATRRVAAADAALHEALQVWRAAIAQELSGLSQAFDRHVVEVKGPSGLFADVVWDAPRLSARVSLLKREEAFLRAGLDHALLELHDPRLMTNPHRVKALHALVHDLVERLERHQSRVVGLSYEAANTELGNPV